MPAYRSSAEAEIRDAVVARIRERRPGARIIHEINCSNNGPNRIDLIAVDRAEIIAVEVKSAKDKLDRLNAQIESMQKLAHHVVAAVHEKFLVEKLTNSSVAHYQRDGQFYFKALPKGLESERCKTWVFPEMRRAMHSVAEGGLDFDANWRFPLQKLDEPLPATALNALWRDELYELCGLLRVAATRKTDMGAMRSALRWTCTGKELTRGICAMLRARTCVEADPAIFERIAA